MENRSGASSLDLSELSQGGWSSRVSFILPGLDISTTDDGSINTQAYHGKAAADSKLSPLSVHALNDSVTEQDFDAAPVAAPQSTAVDLETESRTSSGRRGSAGVGSHRVAYSEMQPMSTSSHRTTTTLSEREAEVLEASQEASKEGSASGALKRFQDQKQAKLRLQVRFHLV